MVDSFHESAWDHYQDYKRGHCRSMEAMGYARQLWSYAAMLTWHPETNGGDGSYRRAAWAGNRLLTKMHVTAVRFIPHTCARHVDQTPKCTTNQ